MSLALDRTREYKPLTGEDVGLQQAIFETERGQRTFEAFACWVNAHIGRARNLGTDSLRLFVGCKSGQHRSVAITLTLTPTLTVSLSLTLTLTLTLTLPLPLPLTLTLALTLTR